jgi:hypothetical protein
MVYEQMRKDMDNGIKIVEREFEISEKVLDANFN